MPLHLNRRVSAADEGWRLARAVPRYASDMPKAWVLALRMIPWKRLLANGPVIAAAADALLSVSGSRGAPAAAAGDALRELGERVSALERHDREDAEFGKQMSAQLAELTRATEVLAARQRWLLAMSTMALAVGLLAVVLIRL